MKRIKPAILFLHRWLGLLSGLVVVILGITGCLFVFQYEISQWLHRDLIYTDSASSERLPIDTLMTRAEEKLGLSHLTYGLTTYRDPVQNWTAMNYKGGGDSWTYFGSIQDYRTLYLNPYTGRTTGLINEEKDFFQIVKAIHWSLLLATPIGQPIVAWSTVIFLVLLVSGLILWWPRRWNRTGRKKSFTIRWKARWRRVNYDLHNVLGFYSLILAFIIGFTGLYWAFPFAQKTLHYLGTGEFALPAPRTTQVDLDATTATGPAGNPADTSALESIYDEIWKSFPDAYSATFVKPPEDGEPIRVVVRGDGETYYERSDLSFHPDTGERLAQNLYKEKNRGEKLVSMNYDIHVGAIGGLPGKILAFIGSLIATSLPITGFIIWWNQRK